jgi:non-ribosomal peptide synthetase component E (peptide arylation enzyme)
LDAKSNALARGLRELGVQKGKRVAVSLGNNIEFAVVGSPLASQKANICRFINLID